MSARRAIRTVFFWTHLSIGLLAGGLILLMSVTGVLLGFERQMIAWIDGAPRVEANGAAPLPLDTLLARAGVARADVASVLIKRDPTQPVTIRQRERGAAPILAHPTTGAVLTPSGDGSGQRFFSALRRWHRYVGAEAGALRAQMKVLNGVANLIFLALVLSGLYLWWPRRWSVARLRATAWPQWKHRAGQARDFNWHNSLGFWFALPLAIIIATAAFFSFRWPGQYLDLALGSDQERAAARVAIAEARAARQDAPAAAESRRDAATEEPPPHPVRAEDAALATYIAAAASARPDWAQLTLTLPDAKASVVRIAVAEGNTYRPDLRWTLDVDRASATVATSSGYDDLSTARKLRAWVRFGHTGEVFGIPGQIVATLASAVGVLLVWTGFALAWRRLRQALRRRRRSVPAVAALPDPSLESPAALG
ncbi:PepSY-associated TM helix domain-containing protein [Pseudogemmatithrix spongiicola]|uniref:PepSY-associated TM helix domain-containing protein n=1 Tax=Pseudogemmatithrix spongiicola TaxID=3062599 RepID=A0AA49Q437_9BACT|nr:PepSY-associated TM helix domain-containing protein [Gemmatimonadaceae bacterium 'strain 138']WKW13754.1 PepSY-associated TM helix domain-containing protein [Gemmatimonadaceae bacterium 'strain 318']